MNAVTLDPRWAQIVARDAQADDDFVFSVASTGIYCRAGCPARTPKPENIAFHDSPAAAEAAGFRACKRCRPDEPSLATRHAELIAEACRRIEAAEEPPTLGELADAVGLSPHHFHRLFRKIAGLTPKGYADARRAEKVRGALQGGGTVTEALYEAGFGSSGRFYAAADGALGMAPSRFARGGEGAAIRYGIGTSSLGLVLAGVSDRGVCSILFGDDPDTMAAELARRFPRAASIEEDVDLGDTVAKVVALVEEPGRGFALPLDIRGTAFQQRVWDALRAIPAGETRSYADVARAIGSPRAVRAVAGACATNNVALAIPCHRVVRGDGDISGYRWGAARKRELLAREKLS